MAVIDRGIEFDEESAFDVPPFNKQSNLADRIDDFSNWLDEIVSDPLSACGRAELKAVVAATRRMRGCADRLIMSAGAVAYQRQHAANPTTTESNTVPEPETAAQGDQSGSDGGGSTADSEANTSTAALFEEVMGGNHQTEPASTTRQDAQRAELLAALPRLAAAVTASRVGAAHVDAIGRAFKRFDTPESAAAVLDTPTLINDAEWLPVDTFTRRLWKLVNTVLDRETRQAEAEQKRNASTLSYWFDDKAGMGRIYGQLDPERYETIVTAIEQHMTTLANDTQKPKSKNLAAAALTDLITNSGQRNPNLPHLTIIIGPDGEAETADGKPLTPQAASRLACDAVIRQVTLDRHGVPIKVGRAARTATNAQWAAIKALYSQCAWHSCTAPISRCQAHHIHYWENGGPTDLCNLIPLCSHHHHLVHDQGWALRLRPTDRRLTILQPTATGHRVTAHTKPDRNLIQDE